MSRAFTKESDGEEALTPLQHVESGQPNYITPAGQRALAARIDALRETRASVANDPTRLDAKAALAQVDADLAYLDGRLEKTIVVPTPPPPWQVVAVGAQVEACDEHGEVHRFEVVGEDETDVARGRVSWVSPLGSAVMGSAVGDYVDWLRPAGELTLEIVAISYPAEDGQ